MPKRKRSAYDTAFKLRVVEFAENANNCAAQREFDVSEKLVRDWRKKKSELLDSPRSQKRRVIRPSPYDDMEKDLVLWISGLRQNGFGVSRNAIRLKALELGKNSKYNMDSVFKAFSGWCNRFMNRHGLSLRTRTHIAQKLPADLDQKVTSFHSYVIKERHTFDFDLSQIGNMDETPMFFDMPGNTTVHMKGDSTVTLRTTGSEKQHFTVILACMADGTKLKPAVVFKRKTIPKVTFPTGLHVFVQQKGWVDENILRKWLEKVWFSRPGGLSNKDSLLVWDMFRAHLTESVKKDLKERKTRTAVIPGGTTSVLQPLDVCLNKPFKVAVRHQWNEWMINGPCEVTKAGNLKRPDLVTVCNWIVKAWNGIDREMIIRSFLKCGISNSLDGSQDDELYDDLLLSGPSEPVSDIPCEDSDVDDGPYDSELSEQQIRELFESDSEEEEFEGF